MLVNNVESVEFPQTVIPSCVRIETVYPVFDVLGDSFCFSRRVGFVSLSTLADREVQMRILGVSGAPLDQSIGEVVKSRPKAVDGVSGDERDAYGDRRKLIQEIGSESVYGIELGSSSIRITAKKDITFPLQITDVLVGPFNFCSCSLKFGACHEDNLQDSLGGRSG